MAGSTPFQVGEELKPGLRVNKIIRGGMSVIYILDADHIDKYIVAKSLDISRRLSSASLDRFKEECRTWLMLPPHPNLAQPWAYDNVRGTPHLFMDYFQNGSIGDRLRQGPLNPEFAIGVGLKIAGLLDSWQTGDQNRIVHRDIKPSNILIDENNQPKLTDFGLVAATSEPQTSEVDEEDGSASQATLVLGTPAYMSPEQLASPDDVDVRADIYSLGVTLFEMLTGLLPFRARTTGEMVKRILAERPSPPSSVNSDISADVDEVILSCLAKDPGDRFQTPDELIEALLTLPADLADRSELVKMSWAALEQTLSSGNWNARGYMLRMMDDHAAAVQCYHRAIDVDLDTNGADVTSDHAAAGHRAMLYLNRCAAHEAMTNYELADRDLETAASLVPSRADIVNVERGSTDPDSIARELANLDVLERAMAVRRAGQSRREERHSDYVEYYRENLNSRGEGSDWFDYLRALLEAEREDELLQTLERFTQWSLKRSDVSSLHTFACLLVKVDRTELAVDVFENVLLVDSANPHYLCNYAIANLDFNVERSVELFDRCLDVDPNYPGALVGRGILLAASRDPKGLRDLERYVSAVGDGPFVGMIESLWPFISAGVPAGPLLKMMMVNMMLG